MAHNYSRKPNPGSGAMQSRVGNPQIYEGNDQKTSKKAKSPDQLVYEVHKEMGGDPAHDLLGLSAFVINPHPLSSSCTVELSFLYP